MAYPVSLTLPSQYPYVALTALWVYDYILCIPDAVECIVKCRWGLGTFLYLACSHLPFAFVLLNMLTLPLYEFANICIFILRAFAVWERVTWLAIFAIVSVIAYLVPILIYIREAWSASGECWVPGALRYLDTESVYVIYGLLAVAELEILLFLLYRAVKNHGGWKTDNRFIRGLLQQHLLYFSCSIALILGVIITTYFLPSLSILNFEAMVT
ncbi:uncharacterized protein EDB93DRAFT_1107497 [Suillus bovinus]|uniref:uncharacterized protein n=1 Tax=Suillus bovinus TaxID=48563 RepID=UPI001B879215|nr:uncharacterized protein EDB93DRAFT_1107497 [Suillus bovinus]KAG2133655.1 hypothetical protein EDB93DRAFT_1107497 [Suillus bovinus]